MTRWRRGIAFLLWPLIAGAGGCALPVTMPLAPLLGNSSQPAAVNVTTGSTGAAVEEDGLSEHFGSELWRSVRPAIAQAVEFGEDNQPIIWRSRSGSSGSVVPVAAYFDKDGDVCRRLAIIGARDDGPAEFLAEACREGDLWRVRPAGGQA